MRFVITSYSIHYTKLYDTSKSASDKKQDIEFKGEDENGDVVVGNNISWPKDVPNDLKIKASITSVVKDETSGTVGITFEQLNQEDATAYIENLKKLGYETEFEGTTTRITSYNVCYTKLLRDNFQERYRHHDQDNKEQ